MPLQSSGQITLVNIKDELGGSAPHDLGEYRGTEGIGGTLPTGQISMSDFYGQGLHSFTHLGSITDVDDMIMTANVNGGTLTGDDLLIVLGTHEAYSGTAAYTANGLSCNARVTVTPVQANFQYSGLYIGTKNVSGVLVGDTTLSIAQTTNPGSGQSFRAGAAMFRLENGGVGFSISDTASNTFNGGSTNGGSVSITPTVSSNEIVFICGHASSGDGTTNTISASNGTLTRYEGVTEPQGSGEYAVLTGATNPTITLTSTDNASSSQGLAVAAMVIGYPA